ncbi:MAG TPA: aminotransferase class V-fold PLP-dependent enzyme [Anaerolineae bacterium]|nr:aminotransferase class V-fold PLP-dependent enzyme [Anaerolineae bacterium]
MRKLTIDNVREQVMGIEARVPLLDGSQRQYVNLDNAASTPALRPVHDKVSEFMTWYASVHRGTGFKSQIATEAYDLAHDLVACFVGADPATNTVILGKNTTEAINKLARRYPLEPGDVVLCSLMEHHSNDLPWRQHAELYHVGVRGDGTLDEADFDRLLDEHKGKVRLVAVSGASNVTGTLNPIHRLAEKTHAAGARILVDAAQLAPHRAINVRPDDDPAHLDFVALSAHKMYAPYGTGALVGPVEFFAQGTPDMVGGGTVDIVTVDDVKWAGPPDRDEAGSPNVVGAVAMAQAILSLLEIGMDALAEHEAELTAHALRGLQQIDGVELYGLTDPERVTERVGVIPFNVRGVDHYKVAAVLSFEGGIGVRNGCFCAHPYILHLLDVGAHEALRHQQDILNGTRVGLPGLVRISFGCYNTIEEVDHMIEMLARIAVGEERGEFDQNPASGAYWPRGWAPDYERYFTLQPGLAALPRQAGMPRCGV